MITYISGMIVDKGQDFIVVDNNGMGYQVFYAKPESAPLNEQMVVFTYQHVREDAIILFGFPNKMERDVFLQLISVKGVGPKTGLNILAKTSAQDLIVAVEQEDLSVLKKLPGIGPKTASQILLDLRGKFYATDTPRPVVTLGPLDDALDALINLGFKRLEVNSIKEQLMSESSDDVSALVKKGLQILNARKRG